VTIVVSTDNTTPVPLLFLLSVHFSFEPTSKGGGEANSLLGVSQSQIFTVSVSLFVAVKVLAHSANAAAQSHTDCNSLLFNFIADCKAPAF
jgi:hypothetical protein